MLGARAAATVRAVASRAPRQALARGAQAVPAAPKRAMASAPAPGKEPSWYSERDRQKPERFAPLMADPTEPEPEVPAGGYVGDRHYDHGNLKIPESEFQAYVNSMNASQEPTMGIRLATLGVGAASLGLLYWAYDYYQNNDRTYEEIDDALDRMIAMSTPSRARELRERQEELRRRHPVPHDFVQRKRRAAEAARERAAALARGEEYDPRSASSAGADGEARSGLVDALELHGASARPSTTESRHDRAREVQRILRAEAEEAVRSPLQNYYIRAAGALGEAALDAVVGERPDAAAHGGHGHGHGEHGGGAEARLAREAQQAALRRQTSAPLREEHIRKAKEEAYYLRKRKGRTPEEHKALRGRDVLIEEEDGRLYYLYLKEEEAKAAAEAAEAAKEAKKASL